MIEEIDYDIIYFYSIINFLMYQLWRFILYLFFKLIVMLIIYLLYFFCEGGGVVLEKKIYCVVIF